MTQNLEHTNKLHL